MQQAEPHPLIKAGLLALAFIVLTTPLRAGLVVLPGDTLAVCVDADYQHRSIAMDIANYFLMCQPVDGVRVIPAQLWNERLEGFMTRVENDLGPLRPHIVLAAHGTEDGAQGRESRSATFYHPTYFTQTIENLKKIGARDIVMGSAGCVDSRLFRGGGEAAATWNANLTVYRDLDREITAREGVKFADLHTPLMDAMARAKEKYGVDYPLTGSNGERLAPNAQLVEAAVFLQALGCDGAIGTITVDFPAGKAEGTPGQKILSSAYRREPSLSVTLELESTRYPFCFQGAPERTDSTSAIYTCFPFNEELNRYLLVVRGLGAATTKIKLTWGNQERAFFRECTAGDLAKGVNLAAVFATQTPFEERWRQVEGAMHERQRSWRFFNEWVFHSREELKQMIPHNPELVERLVDAVQERDKALNAQVATLVTPLRHTLTIEVMSQP
ncbi:MAG: hypothetical protein LBK71_10470 [Verrucomicrobiales bacterium]|nr:hypothetical protein [Verrucomicrobiales bacterium]